MLSDSLYSHSCLLHDRRGGPPLGSPEIDEILLGDRRRVIIIFEYLLPLR